MSKFELVNYASGCSCGADCKCASETECKCASKNKCPCCCFMADK